MYNFAGKHIVICGGANGLGLHFAREFSKANGRVSILDLTESQEKRFSHFICDVSRFDETHSVLKEALEKSGKIEALVNCIRAKKSLPSSFLYSEKETWEKGIAVNLGTYFNASSALCELIKDQGGCSIVNISSISASLVSSDQGVDYHCAKAAINQLTRFLAVKYGPYGVRVNSVSPGLISHHASEKASSSPSASYYQQCAQSIPLRRSGGPQEVANLVLFLASEFSSFITGQEIVIDGGLSICEQLHLLSPSKT